MLIQPDKRDVTVESSRKLVIAMPPTTNGDLHVGHMSGAFYAADAYTRHRRRKGDDVLYFSTADNNQTYIETTAARVGVTPEALFTESARQISSTLAAANVAIDAFPSPNAEYDEFVRNFVRALLDRGALTVKEEPFLFCAGSEQAAIESYVKGHCPNCFIDTVGAICETCGHPNNQGTLVNPYWALDKSQRLERREIKSLVFRLEDYRERLKAFFEHRRSAIRPHMMQLVDQLLSKPLTDYPVIYPLSFGIPARLDGFDGQVVNVWVEMLPGLMYSSHQAAKNRGQAVGENFDALWLKENGCEIAYFYGFDNSYYVMILHMALLMAFDGKYTLPSHFIANEFYELDLEKFSTSRRHLIWAKDLLKHAQADTMRYYLALTNPEYQKTSFSTRSMTELVNRRLIVPLNELIRTLNDLLAARPELGFRAHDLDQTRLDWLLHYQDLFDACFDPSTFSLQRAAERLWQMLGWINAEALRIAGADRRSNPDIAALVGLWAYLRAYAVFAEPIMPIFSRSIVTQLGAAAADTQPGRLTLPIRPVHLETITKPLDLPDNATITHIK